MRSTPLMSAALVLFVAGSAFAQEWIEFASREDRFTCNFPGQPKVTETTWTSEHGAVLPARVYSGELGPSRYSMTVVDYCSIQRILTEKSKNCPAGAETCTGGLFDTGLGYWKIDLHGAATYAQWKLQQRNVTLTHLSWNQMGMVGGVMLQLTSNADKSRTFASIQMHELKLYIMEGIVPAGYAQPGLFQQSLAWLDEQGNPIRYQEYYLQGAPTPPLSRGGLGIVR